MSGIGGGGGGGGGGEKMTRIYIWPFVSEV